jgi:hypothetical protein
MSNYYCFTFSAIELTVRNCDNCPNDLEVISCYVHLGLQRAKKFKSIKDVRTAHMRVVNTLLDTMCDDVLPMYWRKHCYRYIKSLLPLIFEMLSLPAYRKMTKEIETLHSFFIKNTDIHSSPIKIQAAPIKK